MTTDKKHIQLPIFFEDEEIFRVDEKMQNLIQFFVDNGIFTYNSCEDNINDNSWIEFSLESWMYITESAYSSRSSYKLYYFIEENCDLRLTVSDDGEPDENDEYWIEGENLIWGASVRFNKELLPTFEQLVKQIIEKTH